MVGVSGAPSWTRTRDRQLRRLCGSCILSIGSASHGSLLALLLLQHDQMVMQPVLNRLLPGEIQRNHVVCLGQNVLKQPLQLRHLVLIHVDRPGKLPLRNQHVVSLGDGVVWEGVLDNPPLFKLHKGGGGLHEVALLGCGEVVGVHLHGA
jgi:hypothetical protein